VAAGVLGQYAVTVLELACQLCDSYWVIKWLPQLTEVLSHLGQLKYKRCIRSDLANRCSSLLSGLLWLASYLELARSGILTAH